MLSIAACAELVEVSYGSFFRRSKRKKDDEFIGCFGVNLV